MRTSGKRLGTLLMVLSLLFSFCLVFPADASADDAVIGKILTTLSATPVALDDPGSITVATSTSGCYIIGAGWYDSSGQLVSDSFRPETYTLIINIGAADGCVIAGDVACYLNNSAVTCSVDPSGKSAVLTRDYTAAVWAPTIYKNPGNETVDEGGWASFVVSAGYATDYEWSLVNETGTGTIPVDKLKNSYSAIEVKGNHSPKLNLYHIPYELNGWKVVCDFIGAGSGNVKRSQPATLTVIPTVSRASVTPAPTPEPAISPEPTTVPVSVTAPVTTSDQEPEPVSGQYSDIWSFDARGHWHDSLTGGPAADEALHSFIWTEIRPESSSEAGQEEGVCSVCGYTSTRRFGGPSVTDNTKDDSDKTSILDDIKSDLTGLERPGTLMMLLLLLIPLDLILVIVHLCGPAKQRRRRRRR